MPRPRPAYLRADILDDLKAKVYAADAKVYQCRWGKYGGWALATVHDSSGMIAIASDHGNWAFIWHPRAHECASLHDFLVRCDADYVAGKMIPSSRFNVADIEGTQAEFKRLILDRRREGRLSKEVARERWDEVTEWDEDALARNDYPGWIDVPYEYVQHKLSPEAESFIYVVWPAVRIAIKAEVERRIAAAAVAATTETGPQG